MDASQGVTLMEIFRMVEAIKRDVEKIADDGHELREAHAGTIVILSQHDHDLRSLKQNALTKTRIVAMTDSVSVKSLIAIITAVSALVSGMAAFVAAYFKG